MSLLPAPLDKELGQTPRQLAQAKRAQAKTELELFRYSLGARARAQIDQLDSQAVADATRTALEEEMNLLDYGLSRSAGSAAKAELVARHVNRLAVTNDRRLTNRFGG
jgi:hypothetical protein